MRQGSLRQLQLSGRLGSASLDGTDASPRPAAVRSSTSRPRMPARSCASSTSTGAWSAATSSSSSARATDRRRAHECRLVLPAERAGAAPDHPDPAPGRHDGGPGTASRRTSGSTSTRSHSRGRGSTSPAAAGRLDFKDAAIWARQVGFTLDGFIDYARDRADISGTFVPAYGVNNVFSQVPLFGPLLGGGRNEGLFAVNFRVAGPGHLAHAAHGEPALGGRAGLPAQDLRRRRQAPTGVYVCRARRRRSR